MRRSVLAMMGAAAVFGLAVGTANAGMVLFVDDPATVGVIDLIIADDAPAGTATAIGPSTLGDLGFSGTVAGFISFTGLLPGTVWSLVIDGSTSKPNIGPPPELDVHFRNSSTAAGILTVGATDTSFFHPTLPVSATNSIGGTLAAGATLTSTWTADDIGNAEFGIGTMGTPSQAFGPGGAFSGTAMAGPIVASPFSLTNWITMTHTGAGLTSGDSVVRVPEPGTTLLGVIGLGIVGLLRRRAA